MYEKLVNYAANQQITTFKELADFIESKLN